MARANSRLLTGRALANVGVGAFIATLVVLVKGRLGAGDWGYVTVTTGYGVGMVAGGAVVGRALAALGGARLLLIAGVVQTGALVVVGTARSLGATAVALGVFGFASMVWNVLEITIMQERAPRETLGRVSAAFRTLSIAGAPLGAVLGGAVAAGWGLAAPAWLAAALVGLGALAVIPVRGSAAGGRTSHTGP